MHKGGYILNKKVRDPKYILGYILALKTEHTIKKKYPQIIHGP